MFGPAYYYFSVVKNYNRLAFYYVIPIIVIIVYYVIHHFTFVLQDIIDFSKTFLPFTSAIFFSALVSLPSMNNRKICSKMNQIITKPKYLGKDEDFSCKTYLSVILGYVCFMSSILFLIALIANKAQMNHWVSTFLAIVMLWGIASILINMIYTIRVFMITAWDNE